MKIHEALTEVMKAVPVVRKEDRNSAQNFSFRGIDATLNAVGPALRTHGVVVRPKLVEHNAEAITVGRNATPMRSVTVLVEYAFTGPEGDSLVCLVPGEAMDAGDKAYSKAMSVAFRTALLQTLALPTDERDPDADSHERVEAPPIPTPLLIAKSELRSKIRELKLDGKEVAAFYVVHTGGEIADETDPAKIHEFTAKLDTELLSGAS